MSRCPRCGAELLLDAAFCSVCGTPVSPEHHCPGCGRPLQPEDRFCPACGAETAAPADSDETIIQAAPAKAVLEQPVTPPRPVYSPPVYAGPAAYAAGYSPPPVSPPARRKSVWLISCLILLLLACLVLAGAGLYFNRDKPPIADWLEAIKSRTAGAMPVETRPPNLPPVTEIKPIANPPAQFKPGKALAVEANGSPATDEQGVSLQAPGRTISGTAQVLLIPSEGGGQLVEGLKNAYRLDTPFYSVAVQGEADAPGEAELSFPAPNPQSRLAVVIDQAYGGILGIEPDGGRLRVKAHLSPEKMDKDPLNPSITRQADIQYVVLTPLDAAASTWPGESVLKSIPAPGRPVLPEALQKPALLISHPRPAALSPIDCHWTDTKWGYSKCRRSATGLVHVYWTEDNPLTPAEVDPLIELVEKDMDRYFRKGFIAAQLGAYHIVQILIEKDSSGTPLYSQKTGNIYIPIDSLKKITTQSEHFALLHELFHWIQDEEYVMNKDALFNENGWWMDISAENGVFLLEPEAQAVNLTTYGQTEVPGGMLGLQSAPYLWARKEESRYIHAQLLKVNMCDNSAECALSEKDFIQAINKGEFPLSREGAKEKISRNIDDYARYIMGAPPLKTNTGIGLPAPVKNGLGLGDSVFAYQRMPQNDFQLKVAVNPSRLETGSKNLPLKINTEVQKDGLYHLRVSNGGKAPAEESTANYESGYPLALTVADDVEAWYREGDKDPQFKAAGQKLIIQPIHLTMGLPSARVAVAGKGEAQKFKGTLDVVDLRGDWLFVPGKVRVNTIKCTTTTAGGSEPPDTSSDPNSALELYKLLHLGMALGGAYKPPSTLTHLEWAMDPSTWIMQQTGVGNFRGGAIISKVDISNKDIRFRTSMSKPNAQLLFTPKEVGAALPAGPIWPTAFIGLFSAGGLAAARFPRRRAVPLLLVLAMLSLAILACDISFVGYVKALGEFKKIEYVAKADKPLEPEWRLSNGTGSLDVDTTVTSDIQDAVGSYIDEMLGAKSQPSTQPQKTLTHCAGHAEYELEGLIYKDGVISMENIQKQIDELQKNAPANP